MTNVAKINCQKMSIIEIRKCFESKKLPNRVLINFKILERISETEYLISDGDGCFKLEISSLKANYIKYFEPGRFVRIIKPNFVKKSEIVTLSENSLVVQGLPIQKLPDVIQDFKKISDTFELEVNTDFFGKLLAKIVDKKEPVFLKPNKSFVQATLKDLEGSKTNITFWSNDVDCNEIEVNQVYIIENIRTGNYPSQKPFFLSTKRNTRIKKVTDTKYINKFKAINFEDGKFDGIVLGFYGVLAYYSCNFCNKGLNEAHKGGICINEKCKKTINELQRNFVCQMIVADGDKEQILTVFKKKLDLSVDTLDNDLIETNLTKKFVGIKKAKGTYVHSKKNIHEKNVQEIEFY